MNFSASKVRFFFAKILIKLGEIMKKIFFGLLTFQTGDKFQTDKSDEVSRGAEILQRNEPLNSVIFDLHLMTGGGAKSTTLYFFFFRCDDEGTERISLLTGFHVHGSFPSLLSITSTRMFF